LSCAASLAGFRLVIVALTIGELGQLRAEPVNQEVGTRRAPVRGDIRERIPRAATAYRQAIARGSRKPTEEVAQALNVGRSTAARAISAARAQGLLGPALRARAGEQPALDLSDELEKRRAKHRR
jgi:hypothetical protein